MPEIRLDDRVLDTLARLLRGQRWVAMASVRETAPLVSQVAYVVDDDLCGGLLYLSRLAAHTRNLLANPRAALSISEADDGRPDPQTLARVTLEGEVRVLPRDTPAWSTGRERYLAALPESAPLFAFTDFSLLQFAVAKARFVGGFANAHTFGPERLREAALRAGRAG
jgi:hypothetical protein